MSPAAETMSMNCRCAQSQIALWLGEGLEGGDEQELRRHLSQCATCCEHLTRLRSSLACLHAAEQEALPATDDRSLWPRLSTRLPSPRQESSGKFVGTTALAAVAMAWLLVGLSAKWSLQSEPPTTFISAASPQPSYESRNHHAATSTRRSAVQIPVQSPLFPGWPPPRQEEMGLPEASFPFLLQLQGQCPHCGRPVIGGVHVVAPEAMSRPQGAPR
jgi:hypothetical protein